MEKKKVETIKKRLIQKRIEKNKELEMKRRLIIEQRNQIWRDSQQGRITDDVFLRETYRLENEYKELKPLPNRIFLIRKPVGEVTNTDDMNSDWTCSICLEHKYEEDETDVLESELIRKSVVWLNCGHCFHFGCIDTLFNSTSKHICPLCQKNNGLEVNTIRTEISYCGKRKLKSKLNKKSKMSNRVKR